MLSTLDPTDPSKSCRLWTLDPSKMVTDDLRYLISEIVVFEDSIRFPVLSARACIHTHTHTHLYSLILHSSFFNLVYH